MKEKDPSVVVDTKWSFKIGKYQITLGLNIIRLLAYLKDKRGKFVLDKDGKAVLLKDKTYKSNYTNSQIDGFIARVI